MSNNSHPSGRHSPSRASPTHIADAVRTTVPAATGRVSPADIRWSLPFPSAGLGNPARFAVREAGQTIVCFALSCGVGGRIRIVVDQRPAFADEIRPTISAAGSQGRVLLDGYPRSATRAISWRSFFRRPSTPTVRDRPQPSRSRSRRHIAEYPPSRESAEIRRRLSGSEQDRAFERVARISVQERGLRRSGRLPPLRSGRGPRLNARCCGGPESSCSWIS